MRFSHIIFTMACTAFLLLLYSCANIVPPEGGKKDETPPVLLSISPADSALNIRPTKLELQFNKFMEVKELEKNLQLSPLMPIMPVITSYGKRVEIKIQDTQLLANTTYRISLGNALVDNREGNPYPNFEYIFSTGAYFDSLTLQGKIFDAATGLSDTATLITLYAAGENDTAVIRKKPLYAIHTDASGNFVFRSLPARKFIMYAIQDVNRNYIYDYGAEKIGFLDSVVIPTTMTTDSLYTFYMFKEVIDTTTKERKEQIQNDSAKNASPNGKDDEGLASKTTQPNKIRKNGISYRVNVDTSNIRQRSFEITNNLTIDLYTELKNMDTAKVYLSYENNGIEVEAVRNLLIDSNKIKISTQWQSDKVYTLRLIKGWAKDTSGAELEPGKYFFHTKGDEDYGTLKIHLAKEFYNDSLLLYIYKGTDSIYHKSIKDSVVTLSRLQPGDYGMRIIVDANRNGKWDAGILFKKQQPEKVIPYNNSVIMKAGWENELDFTPADSKPKQGRTSEGNRPGTSPGGEKEKKREFR